jgi:DNA segregation ATPase FtsK/SpoIIIE, S-DNA-T family
MPETSLIQRESAILHELTQLAVERAKAESGTKSGLSATAEAAESEFQQKRQEIAQRFESDSAEEERTYQEEHGRILSTFKSEHGTEEKDFQRTRNGVVARFEATRNKARKSCDEKRWEAATVYDASRDGAKKQFEKTSKQLAGELETFEPIGQFSRYLLNECKRFVSPAEEEPHEVPDPPDEDPLRFLQEAISRTDALSASLNKLALPRVLKLENYAWIVIVLCVALAYPGWLFLGFPIGLVAAVAVGLAVGIGLHLWLRSLARVRVGKIYPSLCQALKEVEAWGNRCQERAAAHLQQQKHEITERRDTEVQRAEEALEKVLAELDRRRIDDVRQLDEQYAKRRAEIQEKRDRALEQLEKEHTERVNAIKARFENDTQAVTLEFQSQTSEGKAGFQKRWDALADRWQKGMTHVQDTVAGINQESARLFPDWSGPGWENWTPATQVPPGLRFGEFRVLPAQIPYGIPHDEHLKAMTPTELILPALLPIPTGGSLLLKAVGAGREAAVQCLQAVMLRYLTALPPGKVRFTIIDPVGLGQNFSGFMHLADYDEALVTSRIWTEPSHIEQRLTDLTDHMENVIQKYLRNEFETIEQYNINAGEVAEPFRFLVIANFPVNFSDSTARRLISIASSGARCGVYTLISVDAQQALPQGCMLKDLERHSLTLVWKDQRFVWRGSEFEQYPLQLDAPPPPEILTPLMHTLGAMAKEATRVEVPFEFIAPADDQWWTSSSSDGIDVPLGKSGATRLQHLKLGKGTSQHVLIAGRTGSGKSTLLHALITNLALHYSPEEVELYLIDFKKGVEFKTYATHELPHARVVAIESEREFGLSVLQRLDAELKYRGEKFRDVGAQDLNAYRQANGNAPTPRILLIVDEFQEFFVEDDKVAAEASLLLDRLVRQGRAFGIHVHLGSQTLSGAYSLARSTLGQMAVRIALQCSESDAHLILSEENSAARLLSRPGEAIYNDANGLVEGNHFFQVVWLPDDRREVYLERLHELARQRNLVPAQPQIVFEGNIAANPAKNALLHQLLSSPTWPASPRAAQAWMGEAIAIKDPTAAVFRPQSGSNLLIIGQQDESALGILSMAVVSLASQYPPAITPDQPAGARFYILDGSPVDSVNAGYLAKLADITPLPVQVGGWRELPAIIDELAQEVERRQASESSDAQSIYLIIYDVQRFRDLRKADDDFGFSKMGEDEKPGPAKQFANIVREGPGFGVHTLLWCDTLNNVNRTLERQAIREFEMRVLFQMSANDSSTLIDSPIANKLGPHRALFFSEEQGRLEKFRPYGIPSPEWLDWVRSQFGSRAASPFLVNPSSIASTS